MTKLFLQMYVGLNGLTKKYQALNTLNPNFPIYNSQKWTQ